MKPQIVLSIDPGRGKCGLAVVSRSEVIHRQIVSSGGFADTISHLLTTYSIDAILVGNGTGSGSILSIVAQCASGMKITSVEESYTSEKARIRYFRENPPRGLRRLLPRGLLFPDAPYDDLVAVILAENFFESEPPIS